LLTGTNQQGKTRLSMAISETLHNQGILNNWRILVFDVVGHWKQLSSVPYFVEVKKLKKIQVPEQSTVFDISYLLPSEQKQFVEATLLDLWNSSLDKTPEKWTLCIFEESQLYCRNVRSKVSEQIQRIFSVGANHKIRSLAIAPSLTGLDPEFIRLCNQRYHFRLGNEQNIKKKFRSYYGLDWCNVALNLDVGFFVYYLNGKLEVKHINLFESETKSQPLQLVKPQVAPNTQRKNKEYSGFFGKLINWLEIPKAIKKEQKPLQIVKEVNQVDKNQDIDDEENQDLDYWVLTGDEF
jgi:hypothetical protein